MNPPPILIYNLIPITVHPLEEIRVRALDSIISKFDFSIQNNCVVYKELILNLFQWFFIDPVSKEEKVLNLLIRLIQVSFYDVYA